MGLRNPNKQTNKIQPIPLGWNFWKLKDQSSNVSFAKLQWKETFELEALSFRKCHRKWDWLYYFKTTFICPRSIAGVPCDSVRRFQATLLLRTTCMRLWGNWVARCVAAYQTKNQTPGSGCFRSGTGSGYPRSPALRNDPGTVTITQYRFNKNKATHTGSCVLIG